MHRSIRRIPLVAASAALLALLLTACTIYVVPGDGTARGRVSLEISLDEVITEFAPVRGEGATYRVGQQIQFRLRTRQSGYVTLTALDPDGSVYTLARNLRVEAGRTNILPGPEGRVAFVAESPTGLHRVRASFTRERTQTSRVRFTGRSGEDGWRTALRIELEQAEVRDVAETFLVIRR